jgi:Spy/CpxP family protein refolding chaperone
MKKALPILLTLAAGSLALIAEPEAKQVPKSDSNFQEHERRKGPRGSHEKPDQVQHLLRVLHHLQLDESQKEIAKGLMKENQVKREEYHSQMESLVDEMNELRESESSDENRMIEVGGELGKLKVKTSLLMKHFFEGIKVHLTEEQLTKFNEMRERMKKMAKHMKSKRGFQGKPGGPGGFEGRKFPGRGGPDGGPRFKGGDQAQKPGRAEADKPALEL